MGYNESIYIEYDEDEDAYLLKTPFSEQFNRELGASKAFDGLEFLKESRQWKVSVGDDDYGLSRLEDLLSLHFPGTRVIWST